MCGIAGIITLDGSAPDHGALEAMQAALAHRGPDGGGVRVCGNIGLVHTRLAIIDLKTGDQPLFGPDGSVLVSNGEIYNYVELNDALGPGINRRTSADFEPFLHLASMADAGGRVAAAEAALARLRGMFGLAWHTEDAAEAVLARDPFGIKPLHIAQTESALLFASEPRAIFATGLVTPSVEDGAIRQLGELGYTADGVYAGLSRLQPWHVKSVSRTGAGITQADRPFGALDERAAPIADMDDAVTAFDSLFEDSVRLHQRADVPYGLFLSGGIDSSAILTMMARLNDQPVRSFTCGFIGDDVADERPAARRVADALGADHSEITFSEEEFWALLPQVAWALDDPTVDYAVLPTWKLGQAARSAGLKVVLSGEGGDEVFAGYGRYRYLMKPWWRGGRKPKVRGRLSRIGLGGDAAWRDVSAAARSNAQGAASALEAAQRADMRYWLAEDLLLKLDRCLMAHGVEGRVPFLDPPLVEFGLGLPAALKVADNRGKAVVRHWLARHCPAADAFSRKKGFTVPVGRWISRGGAGVVDRVADDSLVRSLVAPEAVHRVFSAAGETHAGMAAWTLLFLAVWHRVHLHGADPAGTTADVLGARERVH